MGQLECASALCRLERDGGLNEPGLNEAIARLNDIAPSWQVIQGTSRIRAVAVRLLRIHPLGAADALQLAAALEASENEPRTLRFVTLDERLARSAGREGFPIVDFGGPTSSSELLAGLEPLEEEFPTIVDLPVDDVEL
ncbi:MAG: PIN domain-containing protein [Gemmatimonadota bacterium]